MPQTPSHSSSVSPYTLQPPKIGSQLQLETQKLYFLRATELEIKNRILAASMQVSPKKKRESGIKYPLQKALYVVLAAFGLLQEMASGYIFANTLLYLIPGILNPALIGLSILFSMFQGILFYAFEVSSLKKVFGFSIANKEARSLLDIYAQQLKTTIAINQLLSTIHVLKMDRLTYEKYAALAVLFNEDLKRKKEQLGEYHEPMMKNVLKWVVLGFGIFSNVARNYFMVTAILTVLSPALLGTPVGWILILLAIATGLGFHYAMGARSILRLVNPNRPKFQTFKEELQQFKPKEAHDFEEIHHFQHTNESVLTKSSNKTSASIRLLAPQGVSLFSRTKRSNSCPDILSLSPHLSSSSAVSHGR